VRIDKLNAAARRRFAFREGASLDLQMKTRLLGFEILDQDLDALTREVIGWSQCERPVMLDPEIDFVALLAHRISRSVEPGPFSISSPMGRGRCGGGFIIGECANGSD